MSPDKEAVRQLGDQIGYGNMMFLAEECWHEKLERASYGPGGEFAVGPCATFMVPCPHLKKTKAYAKTHGWLDPAGHCDWCCGAGRVTRKVAAAMLARKKS